MASEERSASILLPFTQSEVGSHQSEARSAQAEARASQPPRINRKPEECVPESETYGGRRQCTAKTQTGARCKSSPVYGSAVCVIHGGATPMAQRAARERLMAMCEPAFAVLLDAMQDPDGDWDIEVKKLKVKAAIAVLDRAGHGPSSRLEVAPVKHDFRDADDERLQERVREMDREIEDMRLLKAARDRVAQSTPSEIDESRRDLTQDRREQAENSERETTLH